jgi:hypothetical protein
LKFVDGSVWHIDIGWVQQLITGAGDITDVRNNGQNFTPGDKIPSDWIETKR